mmetsp:Transcript_4432/g.14048  ORF Transcript_4432/g.14048 Transcript_4432/m.14048 type:complete len:282 (-) Transcript_4432:212-1057(-)
MSELGRCSGVGRCSGERTAPAAGRLAADWLKMEEGAPPFVRRPCARACSRRCMCSERMKPSMPDPSIDAETLGTESRGSESREPQKEEGAEGRWRVLWPAVIMIALAADLSRRDEPGGSLGLPPSPPLLPHRFGEPRAAEAEAQAAQAAAQRAQERADAEVVQAEGAVRRADELFARLAADEQPAALRAAADARQRAEDGPVGSAAEALREAYGSFALGAARVLRGDRLPSGYCPTAKRKAPKETGARWFASCECALFLWAGITGFLLEAPGSRRTWCSGL